ncbi:MAG: hypothetical protein OEY64_08160 [Nitrospinota bacterium]|nr:hypothetical protein [Nitrospinota bacterium]
MNYLFDIAIFVHVLSGIILAMTLIIMQLVVNPALSKIPAGNEKMQAAAVIQGRWHPIVDVSIILLTLTAVFFFAVRWEEIVASPLLHLKITCGIITLAAANLLHFYFRGVKKKLKSKGETEKLAKVNALTAKLEKTALIFGAITFVCALLYNHSSL